MYCLVCEYELTGLDSHCCPECGREFNPADPSTFAKAPNLWRQDSRARRFEIALIALATSPMIANALAYTALLAARLSLGHWPHRMGRDDPTDIAFLGPLPMLAMLTLLTIIPAALVGIMLMMFLATQLAWARLIRGGLIAIALWTAGVAFTRWDPALAWMWLFD